MFRESLFLKQPIFLLGGQTAPSAHESPLVALEQELHQCERCPLATQGRTHVVFGEGNPSARLLIVGEGPGEQEDRQGRPFVGPAGQLLTRMIQSIGLVREETYICNVVKCRPPQNRNPEPIEIETCSPFLMRQIEAVNPEVILTLGRFSSQVLLGRTEGITRLRGRVYEWKDAKVIPSFHPSYLLRNPAAKREAWQDLQKVAELLGILLPKNSRA